jgi:hypothetical protein
MHISLSRIQWGSILANDRESGIFGQPLATDSLI